MSFIRKGSYTSVNLQLRKRFAFSSVTMPRLMRSLARIGDIFSSLENNDIKLLSS
ncbi:MAG: hypothetical protein ACD_47C00274G0001, partial [uncultured bacterium]